MHTSAQVAKLTTSRSIEHEIEKALGGVLTAAQMADGFMMLADGKLPNGSVMRVTARRGGTQVVHDVMV